MPFVCLSAFAEGDTQAARLASSLWIKRLCIYEAQGCLCALALAPLCLNASHAKRPFPSPCVSITLCWPSGEKKAMFSGGTQLTLVACRADVSERAGKGWSDSR